MGDSKYKYEDHEWASRAGHTNPLRGILVALPLGVLLWCLILAAAWGVAQLMDAALGAAF